MYFLYIPLDSLRVRYFSNLTFNMIFYFGLTDPSIYYQSDKVLIEVWAKCKKLWKLVDLYFRLRLIEKDDIKHYCDVMIYKRLPKVSEGDFAEMMEAILTLDTLNRVT